MVFRKRHECVSLLTTGEALPPLPEGPPEDDTHKNHHSGVREWVKGQINNLGLKLGHGNRGFRAKQLLSSIGILLGPFPVGKLPPTVSPKDCPIETSSAQYIIQQYIAAVGGSKLLSSLYNTYATGRVKMVLTDFESPATNHVSNSNSDGSINTLSSTGSSRGLSESGCFVLWQMSPDKWYVELVLGRTIRARAGCDSNVVWKQGAYTGSQAFRGPVRPLRRALYGLDPRTLAAMFSTARCAGENRVAGEDCFVLKLSADPYALNASGYRAVRDLGQYGVDPGQYGQGEEEVIRHVAHGYFSQRSGLLVRMDDSQLTRVTASCGEVSYWEITVETTLGEYRAVDDCAPLVAHAGTTVVSIFRFGEESMCHWRTRVVEEWCIEDAAYNVAGLSTDCFLPPSDLQVDPKAVDG